MFETTSAAKEMAPGERGMVRHLEIHGIGFEEGDPCRPRYGDLYEAHTRPEEVQLEPAFQVGGKVKKLSINVRLDQQAPVELVDDPERPGRALCRVLNEPDYRPQVTYKGQGRRACTLTWERLSEVPVTRVFRIYCRPTEGRFTDEQKIHGGLFLAFTTAPVGKMGRAIPSKPPGNDDRRKVFLIGADEQHRPIYDAHKRRLSGGDSDIELEPAFRVRKKARLSFEASIAIPHAAWGPDLTFLQPRQQPAELRCELASEGKTYLFDWENHAGKEGRITSFHLHPILPDAVLDSPLPKSLLDEGWEGWEEYREALEDIGVDPTIIEPPSCDPVYGVCSP